MFSRDTNCLARGRLLRTCVCVLPIQDEGAGMQRQLTRKMQAVGLLTEVEEEVRDYSLCEWWVQSNTLVRAHANSRRSSTGSRVSRRYA